LHTSEMVANELALSLDVLLINWALRATIRRWEATVFRPYWNVLQEKRRQQEDACLLKGTIAEIQRDTSQYLQNDRKSITDSFSHISCHESMK
jgi:hypothetical protein